MAKSFKGQNYSKLRRAQLRKGQPFTDPLFPPTNSSLFIKNKIIAGKIEWKRPGDICSNPMFFVEGISSGDVNQGQLGNCWFVAACSVLAGVKDLWHKVIPDYKDQEWDPKNPDKYAGIFHFRFWRFGEWVDVVVDDLLPTINGRLIFTHSQTKNEFWCALLEKAYAKVNGCYESLDGGNLSDALLDFTSGISETINIKDLKLTSNEQKRHEFFKTLLKQKENHALMCCAVAASTKAEMETRTSVGLVKGHAYGITAIRRVNLKDTRLFAFLRGREKINMVRLRNPWGEKEWNGPFSDGSPEWQRISSAEREKLGLTFEEDGEFWMTFDDFVYHFTEISVCHLLNTAVFSFSRRWFGSAMYGRWTTGGRGSAADRAGGCANNRNSFLRNPQYCFDINEDGQEVVIQLSQRDIRERRREGAENLVIGLHILKVEDNRKYRIHTLMETAGHSDYIKTRSIILRQEWTRGRYILLPTTFQAGQTGDFLLRFFATCPKVNLRELTLDAPKPSMCPCVSAPVCVTTILIRKVTGLPKADFSSLNPYCLVKCEGKTERSQLLKNSEDPVWNFALVFYRKSINQPIIVEVWNSSVVVDTLLGQVTVEAKSTDSRKTMVSELSNRSGERMAGRMTLEYQTEEDLDGI